MTTCEAWEILDLLTALVDKSLVVYETGQARYRLLETVRQYGRERLMESGEGKRLFDRHASYFLGLAEEAEEALLRPEQAAWYDRLEQEHDNFRTALEWLHGDTENAGGGLRLTYALWRFWQIRGYLAEGRAQFDQALAHPGADQAVSERTHALFGAAILATTQGDYAAARPLFEECLAQWRQEEYKPGIAMALNDFAILVAEQGDMAGARPLFEEALAINRELENLPRQAMNLSNLAEVCWYLGDQEAALPLYEQALAVQRKLGDKRSMMILLNNLGQVALERQDLKTARQRFAESLKRAQEIGDRRHTTQILGSFADLARAQGHADRAARLYGAAERLREVTGIPVPLVFRENHERTLAALREQLGMEAFAVAWEAGRALSLEQASEYALEDAGSV